MSVFLPSGNRSMQADRGGEPAEPYKVLAARFGVCWQRIRQIEYRAIEKMKAAAEKEAEEAGMSLREWMTGE